MTLIGLDTIINFVSHYRNVIDYLNDRLIRIINVIWISNLTYFIYLFTANSHYFSKYFSSGIELKVDLGKSEMIDRQIG